MQLLLLLMFMATSFAQIDRTIIPETFGNDVVEAAIDKIKFTCIFPDDSEFARRMAYVETNDGQIVDTYPDDYNGGIWKIDESMYNQTKNPTNQETYAHIQFIELSSSLYNIDWFSTNWEDLRKPLFSALAAKLYMFDQVGRDYDIPRDIDEQADFWQDYIRPNGDNEDFVTAANTLQENCDTATGADLVFVLDGSGSIGSANFETVKDFVVDVVNVFDIQPEKYRIGVQKFSDSNEVEFFLSTYDNKEDVVRAVERIQYRAGGTNTAEALDDLVDISFNPSNGARDDDPVYQQIAFVLTDGYSNDEDDTIEAARRVHEDGIVTFSISVGDNIKQTEIRAIASDPDCIHTYELNDFEDFAKIIDAIQKSTCNAPILWDPSNETTEGEFLPGEGVNCQVNIPLEGATVKVTSNDVPVNYYISQDNYPSPAYYEDYIVGYPDQTGILFLNGTLAKLIYCHILNNGSIPDNITIGVLPGPDDNCEDISCLNGGYCNDLIKGDPAWECVCTRGFEGTYCEEVITTTTNEPSSTTPGSTTTTSQNDAICEYCNDSPCDCQGIDAPNPCPGCVDSSEDSCFPGNLFPHAVLSDGTNDDRFCQCDANGGCFEFTCQEGLIYLECINSCAFPGTVCPS